MRACRLIVAVLLLTACPLVAGAQDHAGALQYKALRCEPPLASGATWAILDRDGANRKVEPYLSSLGAGEVGTGVIASPSFVLSTDAIALTIRGHDGMDGGRRKNFIALVDDETSQTLQQAMAPGSDPMQERSWDVAKLKGRKVRIEVHDGLAEGAYAWLGIGKIDAGTALTVDFRSGMPAGWKISAKRTEPKTKLLEGGVPFLRYPAAHTLIPATGVAEIPCGFTAGRIFVLGCTVPDGKPLAVYGTIEISYRNGDRERFPLMFGFTLDGQAKLPSPSGAIHLHPSADPFQFYLVLAPNAEVIEKITLRKNPQQAHAPRITAITCQTAAESDRLEVLPEPRLSPREEQWIGTHAITSTSPKLQSIVAEIRRAHKMPTDE